MEGGWRKDRVSGDVERERESFLKEKTGIVGIGLEVAGLWFI